MSLKKYISVLLIVLSTGVAMAQVQFQAKVSKKTLGQNQRLRIEFSMNEDGDHFNSPSFDGFQVVGGPNQSVSNSWINGKRSYEKTYSYFLQPTRQGSITINAASIKIKGQTYKTKPITIKVTKAGAAPAGTAANNVDEIVKNNIHLVAEVTNAKPYLNEAITVVYKLYVAPNTGVSNWSQLQEPKFDGFWSQNINDKGLKVKTGKYKGEDYRYVVLRKTVLYPQKTGKLKIDPLKLDITVDIPTNRRDIFGRRATNQVHKTVTAPTRIINVKPFPEAGKPSDFTGAVGDFNFKLLTSKNQLNANESLEAKLMVSGKGNLKLFNLPKLTLPSSLEVYEPEHKEKVRTNFNGMKGDISDTYTIIPQYKGKYPIPSVSFSYFDPKTESYKRIASVESIINVIEGPVFGGSEANVKGADKQDVVANNQFAFLKTEANLETKQKSYFFKSTAFWASLITPLLAIPLAIVFRRKRDERAGDVVGNRLRKADKLAKKYLGEAKNALGKKEAFYVALEKALHNYLKAKLNIETSDLSKEKIKTLLFEREVEQAVINDFESLLENCELARYTPITSVTMQQDYEKSANTIGLIDKQIR